MKDLYCFQCSLQFDKKSIYDMHLSIVHKYKSRTESFLTEIKSEPEDMELTNESSEIPINHTDYGNSGYGDLRCNTEN